MTQHLSVSDVIRWTAGTQPNTLEVLRMRQRIARSVFPFKFDFHPSNRETMDLLICRLTPHRRLADPRPVSAIQYLIQGEHHV